MIFEGWVYDVENYMPHHPGGSDVIEPLVGKSIDDAFEEQGHSKAAKNIMYNLPKVGKVESFKFTKENE